jgi:hypothetical protein
MHNFTPEDLLRYVYNETSIKQTAEIKNALEKDWTLKEQYEAIVSGQNRLEALKLSPRKKTIENILNYAEKSITELSA